jgi:hypothetical protein
VLELVPEGDAELELLAGGIAPGDKLAVGEPDVVEDALRVGEGVPLPVPKGEDVALPVGEALCEAFAITLPLSDAALEAEGIAPGDRVAVGEAVTVVQAEGVEEAPRESEGVGDSLAALEEVRASEAGGGEPVALPAAVTTATLALGERGSVSVREPDGEGVADPLAPGDVIRVSVSEALGEGGGVADGEALGAAAAEPLGVALPVGVTVSVALPVGEPVSEGVALAVALAEPAADAAAEEDAVPLLLVE